MGWGSLEAGQEMIIYECDIMDICEYMAYGQAATLLLFAMSEILGSSTCEYNGVFELLIGGCRCLGDRRYRIRFERGENEA